MSYTYCKDKYPRTIEEFETIVEDMIKVFCSKQKDYGPSNIGMGAETIDTEEQKKKSLMALSVRMNDKVQRMLNLTMNNLDPENETIEDTFKDLAIYSVMGLIVSRKVWGK